MYPAKMKILLIACLIGSLSNCKTKSSENNPIGERLYFKFDKPVTIEKIKYVHGGTWSGNSFQANARLKAFSFGLKRAIFLNKYHLENEPFPITIDLVKPLTGNEFKLIINDTYAGQLSNILFVDELSFFDGKKWFNLYASIVQESKLISFYPTVAADTALIDLALLRGAFRSSDRDNVPDFVFDIKYATKNNFMHEQLYDCDKCLLRKQVAMAFLKARDLFSRDGYRIKIFDCYRPLSIQKKMWEKIKDVRYVANPSTRFGSAHNRGMAIDITLIDRQGRELNMGTKFDFFGLEAHHNFKNFPQEVLKNRRYLKATMKKAGFQPIPSEWWHYSYKNREFDVSDVKIPCEMD